MRNFSSNSYSTIYEEQRKISGMNNSPKISGKCIKADDILLVKIEKNVVIIDDQDLKLLKLHTKIPLFEMSGSLRVTGRQIGLAFLDPESWDVVFIINHTAHTASLSSIEAVLSGALSNISIEYDESGNSYYANVTFERVDWENLYQILKMCHNSDTQEISEHESYSDNVDAYIEALKVGDEILEREQSESYSDFEDEWGGLYFLQPYQGEDVEDDEDDDEYYEDDDDNVSS